MIVTHIQLTLHSCWAKEKTNEHTTFFAEGNEYFVKFLMFFGEEVLVEETFRDLKNSQTAGLPAKAADC